MKSGPFIALLAQTLGVDLGTAKVVARALREAGWLTTGARGVNAPDMTALDAARLILAFMTGAPPSRVVSEFEVFRSLSIQDDLPGTREVVALLDADDPETLEDYLALTLERLVKDRDFCSVETEWGALSNIELTVNDQFHLGMLQISDHRLSFQDFERLSRSKALKQAKGSFENWTEEEVESATWHLRGIQTTRTITAFELLRIADGLAGSSTPLGSPGIFAGGLDA